MTIKTLEFIHQKLIEAEYTLKNARDLAHSSYIKAANDDEATNTDSLHEMYVRMREKHIEARDALTEFEQHEW